MKKLFLLVMLGVSLYANNCEDFYNKARSYMVKSEKAISAEVGIYYSLEASNYLKLFELCYRYNIR